MRPLLAIVGAFAACNSVPVLPADPSVREWIAAAAVPIDGDPDGDLAALAPLVANARVVALGEATHGQSESFATKRRLTMHLVREHGFRVVAYEASATQARACDDYIASRTDDRTAAIRGLSMLIWAVEENGALLDELRAWNRDAEPADRVVFLGCDVQEGEAPLARLRELLPAAAGDLHTRGGELLARTSAATQKMFAGDRTLFDALQPEVRAWLDSVEAVATTLPAEVAAEVRLRAKEFGCHLSMYSSPGGRDRAMADLLLHQLAERGPDARCVLWAHNGHVQRSALRYLGSDELAQGGHLAAALGDRYVAFGFAFGDGGFQANAKGPDGRWGFRRYTLPPPPAGTLDAELLAARAGDYVLDLRHAPKGPQVQQWIATGHGQRWYGGYGVPDDYAERARDAAQTMPTFLNQDFDALVFLAHTTAAQPIDRSRILE